MASLIGGSTTLTSSPQSVQVATKASYQFLTGCAFFLFLAVSALEPTPYGIFFPPDSAPVEVSRLWLAVRFIAFSGPFLAVIGLIGARRGFQRVLNCLPKSVLAYSLIALLSVFWSINSTNSAMQSLLLLLQMSGAASFLILRDQHEDRLKALLLACAAVLAANYAAVILYPTSIQNIYGEPSNLWRGIYVHKNNAGEMCLYFSIVFFSCFRLGIYPKISTLLLAGSTFFLLETGSKTSFWILAIVAVILVISVVSFKSFTNYPNITIRLAGFLLIVTVTLLTVLAAIHLVSQGATFSGRTIAWQQALGAISERPFLGYGYLAFWTDQNARTTLQETLNWAIPHSHNGYLDMVLSVGLIGAAFGLKAMLIPIQTPLFGHVRSASLEAATFSALLAVAYILHNFLESSALDPRSGETLFIFIAILSSRMAGVRPT